MTHNVCGKCLFEMQKRTKRIEVHNYERIQTQLPNGGFSYAVVEKGTRIASVTVYSCPSCGIDVYRTENKIVGVDGEKKEGI